MEKIKWGVLGYARIAQNSVIPAIIRAANSEFYAVASRDPEKLKDCGQRFHCRKLYNDYQALLEDEEVRAVYIPLPNDLHRPWAIQAARHGKHILCEKPLALNSQECREIIAECEKHQVKLMEAFMYRYTDRTRKVIKILKHGDIGTVKYINSSFRFFLDRPNDYRWDPAKGGGSLYDVGCYPVNFAGMVTGVIPVELTADSVIQNGVDSIFSGVMKYENGIIATINCGFNAFPRVYSEIIGDKGLLEIPDTFFGNAGTITLTTSAGKQEIPVAESDRYQLEIEDFAAAILEGRPPLLNTVETIRNMEIIERFYQIAAAS